MATDCGHVIPNMISRKELNIDLPKWLLGSEFTCVIKDRSVVAVLAPDGSDYSDHLSAVGWVSVLKWCAAVINRVEDKLINEEITSPNFTVS